MANQDSNTIVGSPSPTVSRVLDAVKRVVSEHTTPGQMLLIGVSGGPDSVCLLDAMAQARYELGARIHVAHLNHQLRGKASDEDEAYVMSLAQRLNVGATSVRRNARTHQKQTRRSLEDAARQLRHRVFWEVGQAIEASAVLLAHTADDQAETVLMRVIRGTGVRGLAGIRTRSEITVPDVPEDVNRLVLLRPLLTIRRPETEEYCAAQGLEPHIDRTNAKLHAFRNRVRNVILPSLEQENPRVREALLRLSQSAALESDFMEQQVDRLWPVALEVEEGEVILLAREVMAAPRAVRRRLLARAIELVATAGGGDSGLESEAVDRLEQLLGDHGRMASERRSGIELHLPGVRATVEYGRVRLSAGPPSRGLLPEIAEEVALTLPGVTKVGEWVVRAELQEFKKAPEIRRGQRWIAWFDFDRLGNRLVVRARRSGDRFMPSGMSQFKKLQDFFTDVRVPRRLRDRIPLVVTPEGIAWIVGWRQDQRFLPSADTRRVLRVAFERTQPE